MKILHLTDLHLPEPGESLWGLDPYARLDRCLDDMAEAHADADFCLISGDLADKGAPGAYAWLAERLDAFPVEAILMIGNHDDRAVMRVQLPGLMDDGAGFVQGARQTPEGVFLFLDTFKGGTSAGQYCQERQAWLSRELDEAGEQPVFMFMHHPPFDIGIDYMDRIKLEEADAFEALVAGRNIRHLFFGHVHRPVFVTWRGIPCNALPGTNHQVPLSRERLGRSYSIEPPMYSVVLIDGDRTVVHLDAFLDREPAAMDW
jgi:3',5'-cyclic AMP phosphodiesterase CpdA